MVQGGTVALAWGTRGPEFESRRPDWRKPCSGGVFSFLALVRFFHGDQGVLAAKTLVEELASRFQLVELVFDPWRFGQAAQELRQRGVEVVEFPQSDSRMLPASDQ